MIAINSVNNVTTDLRAIRGSMANETVDVLGYYTPNDGGGGTFYWDALSTASDNGGTIIQATGVTTGRWMRVIGGFIDVKWFGCKGDNVTDDTANFQKTLTFVSAQSVPYAVYISRGTYRILAPGSGNDCLYFNVTGWKNCNIYGDGPTISIIRYDRNSSTSINNVLRIKGTIGLVSGIKDFSIYANEEAGHKYGKGLVLEMMHTIKVENIRTQWMDTGIELIDVLLCTFQNLFLVWGKIGLDAHYSNFSSPNLLNFKSCSFGANEILGVKMDTVYGMHSVTFSSCSVEGCGTHGNLSTGGISAFFTGVDGAQGLNLEGCYFEGNRGGFDVKLLCHAFGSHTFIANNFNRTSGVEYTEHNILIDCNGQTPPPDFGYSKVKLTFIGNGFKAVNSYVPSPSRRVIELENGATDYWQYDVVEEGNTYISAVEAPSFDPKTPQISEFTRVKAYGRFLSDGTPTYSYNVGSVTQAGTGVYDVVFANPFATGAYCTSVSPIGTGVIACIAGESNTNVIIMTTDLVGTPIDNDFTLSII